MRLEYKAPLFSHCILLPGFPFWTLVLSHNPHFRHAGTLILECPLNWCCVSACPLYVTCLTSIPTQASQILDLGYWFRTEAFSAFSLRQPCLYTLVCWAVSPHRPHLEPLSTGMFSSAHQNSVSFCFHLPSLYLLILLYCTTDSTPVSTSI